MMVHFETYFESEYIDETVFLPDNYTEEEIQRQADAWLIERLGASFTVIQPKYYSIKSLFSIAAESYRYNLDIVYGETQRYYYRMATHTEVDERCELSLIRKNMSRTEVLYFRNREDAVNWITKESEEL